MSGQDISDPEKEYKILKSYEASVEKRYLEGKMTESKYRSYKAALERWEKDECEDD